MLNSPDDWLNLEYELELLKNQIGDRNLIHLSKKLESF